jgi:NitT/TauT family transport system substrate-binding protein
MYWIDPASIKAAHDFFLKYGVISKPVDIAAAYDSSFLESIPLADRLP